MPPVEPADEKFDIAPDPQLVGFFEQMMLVHGDPEVVKMESMAAPFYDAYRTWLKNRQPFLLLRTYSPGNVLLQYMVWYSNEKQRMLDRFDKLDP